MNEYIEKIKQLEHELDEMTVALSLAWDQLVPFLQEVPSQANSLQDIEPILNTLSTAVETDLAGVYLFQSNEWYAVPKSTRLQPHEIALIKDITKVQTLNLMTENGNDVQWAFAPVMSENERIGILGVGTYKRNYIFTAVDLKIIARMAEKVGSQVTAAQLSHLREREVIRSRDMQIANDIQRAVQPGKPPQMHRAELASYWEPARQVGGDAWGWKQVGDDCLTWFILDVSGKGLPAALAAMALHTAISMAIYMKLSPVDVLHAVNTQFYDAYTLTDLFATVAILSLNTRTGALHMANAGHPPVLIRHDGKWIRLAATAPPIGVLPTLDVEEQVLKLKANDLVIVYSDGFTEIQTEKRLWGQTGLLSTIAADEKNLQVLTKQIVDASRLVGRVEDDQTLITVLYKDA